MEINQEGLALVKSYEGLRLTAYKDSVGVLTIGYGHTGSDVVPGLVIDNAKAEELLKKDLKTSEKGVLSVVKVPLNINEFAALVSFTFNLGIGSLTKSTLLKKLNAGDRKGAAEEFSKWNKAGGKPLNGLTKRRAAERDLFLKPANS